MTELVIALFVAGYLCIAFEQSLLVNKAASALLTGVLCWTALILTAAAGREPMLERLGAHLGDLAGIVFFLLGAMTVVELIDAHGGFQVITRHIRPSSPRALLWMLGLATFFFSAVLDNLTTTIIALSVMRKLVADERDRLYYAGAVVLAANAGGAWSPIGDVTTTMLWIGGQVTAGRLVASMLLPSLASAALALFLIGLHLRGSVRPAAPAAEAAPVLPRGQSVLVLTVGVLVLLQVPVFKSVTHLPPWMGMLGGLAVLWVLTETLHRRQSEEDRQTFSVSGALRRIDTGVLLFFLGILLAVSALEAAGVLAAAGKWMNVHIANDNLINLTIGLLSAVVDNVPLVAAAQGMYGGQPQYPAGAPFWELLAFCTGTGGSVLIIGSAAGVAAMSLEKLSFGWYLRRIGWIALLAYLAGIGVFLLQGML